MSNFFFKIKKIKKNEKENKPIEINENHFNKIVYDIKSISPWPNKTTIGCWHCTRNFDTMPIGIPYKFFSGIYYVKGCFCSFKCAWTYNKYQSFADKWHYESLLNSLYFHFGNTKFPIGEAPPKEILIIYGGKYTNEEYDKLLQSDYVVNIRYPPIVSLVPSISVLSITENPILEDDRLSHTQKKDYRFSRKNRLIIN